MKRSLSLLGVAALIGLVVVLGGCFGGAGKGKRDEPAYQGEFKEFDLYLFPLSTSSGSGGWDLYPGVNVDIWGFTLEAERTSASVPGPEIRVREKDTVRVNFFMGATPMAHTIHWHGLHVPWDMDGVPYISQAPLGATNFGGNGSKVFTYEFQVNQSGTYWYHCHVDTAHHLDMGMYGPFIVEPADPASDPSFDHEVTLMLDEWDKSHAHDNTNALNNAIGKSGDPTVTANDMYGYMRDYLLMNGYYRDTIRPKAQDGQVPGHTDRDWYPVTYPPYFAEYDTFLINGKAFPSTEPVFVKQGEVLRMRLVNSGELVHEIHLHGHHMYVTHTDGMRVPLLEREGSKAKDIDTAEEMRLYAERKDTILIGPGERYDVYVYADNPGPWMIHDHISLHEANDYTHPGGMMTMLCYTDGWANAADCDKGHKMHDKGLQYSSGNFLLDQVRFLGVDPAEFAASGIRVDGIPVAVPTDAADGAANLASQPPAPSSAPPDGGVVPTPHLH